MYITDLVCVLF